MAEGERRECRLFFYKIAGACHAAQMIISLAKGDGNGLKNNEELLYEAVWMAMLSAHTFDKCWCQHFLPSLDARTIRGGMHEGGRHTGFGLGFWGGWNPTVCFWKWMGIRLHVWMYPLCFYQHLCLLVKDMISLKIAFYCFPASLQRFHAATIVLINQRTGWLDCWVSNGQHFKKDWNITEGIVTAKMVVKHRMTLWCSISSRFSF